MRRFAAANAQFHGIFHSADVCPCKTCSKERWQQRATQEVASYQSFKFCTNPFSPYSIQKHPEPQICLNLSQRLFFGAPVGGLKFVKNLSKFFQNCRFSNFDKFQSPGLEPRETIAGTNFGRLSVRGKRVRNSSFVGRAPKFRNARSTVGQALRDQLGPSWSQAGQLGQVGRHLLCFAYLERHF